MSDAWSLLSISDIHFASDSKLDDAKQLSKSPTPIIHVVSSRMANSARTLIIS
jgi:hypothetical protein